MPRIEEQSTEEFFIDLDQNTDVYRWALIKLKIAFLDGDKKLLASPPNITLPTTKDLANKLLKILEEEEKSI
jgi:hypothetical protein